MARNWSKDASALFDAYPWTCVAEKEKARKETELVSFGLQVECDDLPLHVRQWARRRQGASQDVDTFSRPFVWRGESWDEAVAAFERAVLVQVLESRKWNVAAAARALKTTPRIVSYTARKHGLLPRSASIKQHTTTKEK